MTPADLSFFAIIAVFFAFLIFSNKRRKEAATKLSDSVVVGAKVVMAGGVTGIVAQIGDGTIVIESTPGTKIEFVKAAVNSVIPASIEESTEPKATARKKAANQTTKNSK